MFTIVYFDERFVDFEPLIRNSNLKSLKRSLDINSEVVLSRNKGTCSAFELPETARNSRNVATAPRSLVRLHSISLALPPNISFQTKTTRRTINDGIAVF